MLNGEDHTWVHNYMFIIVLIALCEEDKGSSKNVKKVKFLVAKSIWVNRSVIRYFKFASIDFELFEMLTEPKGSERL